MKAGAERLPATQSLPVIVPGTCCVAWLLTAADADAVLAHVAAVDAAADAAAASAVPGDWCFDERPATSVADAGTDDHLAPDRLPATLAGVDAAAAAAVGVAVVDTDAAAAGGTVVAAAAVTVAAAVAAVDEADCYYKLAAG